MEFAWDEAKDAKTQAERGFGFAFAIRIFAGRVLEQIDGRQDYGEVRVKAIGEAEGFVLVVIYTDRDGVRRIIPVRLASRKERELWQTSA